MFDVQNQIWISALVLKMDASHRIIQLSTVVCATTMVNTRRRVGIEHTSPTFRASVLTMKPPRLLDVIILHVHTHLLFYVAPCLRVQCRLLHLSPCNLSLLMLTIIYLQAATLRVHTQVRFNNHTVHGLYRVIVRADREI